MLWRNHGDAQEYLHGTKGGCHCHINRETLLEKLASEQRLSVAKQRRRRWGGKILPGKKLWCPYVHRKKNVWKIQGPVTSVMQETSIWEGTVKRWGWGNHRYPAEPDPIRLKCANYHPRRIVRYVWWCFTFSLSVFASHVLGPIRG